MARPRLPRDEDGNIVRDDDQPSADDVVMSMTPAAIKALVEGIMQANGQTANATSEALRDLIKEQGRTMLKSNAQDPGISVFSYPEGDVARPKPKLNMDTYFCGVRIREETLTPAEITLYNELTMERECREGKWTVKIDRSNTRPRRLVWMPIKTMDDRAQLPESLSLILMELATGKESISRESLIDEVMKLRDRVNALSGATSAA